MGIADILGSITGEAPGPSSSKPAPRPALVPPKRKAEDDLRSAAPKAPRIESNADRLSRPNGNSPRPSPRPSDRPPASSSSKPALSSSRPLIKPSTASAPRPNIISNGTKPLPSRPATTATSAGGPPKRSSFAEIMARAKANSDIRESLGKISHKPLERNLTMKERKELKAEEAKKGKASTRNGPSSRSGSASAPSRAIGKTGAERARVSPTASSASSKAKAKAQAAEEEKKKVKKAALATTGYTGTARPRPGAASASKAGSSARPDARGRSYGGSRFGGPLSAPRRRREEDDSELDDFIVDDEEEDDYGGPEPEYYSDESDMEAGIDDIDAEETAAERRARLEDQAEQALEARLRREKEERKRRAMEAMKRR